VKLTWNRVALAILGVGTLMITLIFAFPPWARFNGEPPIEVGYHWIFSPPTPYGMEMVIDSSRWEKRYGPAIAATLMGFGVSLLFGLRTLKQTSK